MLIIRDAGRKETDRLLADMEQRIAKEYKQAADEAAVKLNNYMQKFKVRDAKKRMELQKGEITQKEYNEWRTGQIMAGRRWRDMTENLAKDYHNANLIAKNIVNGYMPEVYALNFNYGTYEAEHGLKVDTAFTLYDRNTVEYILRENPDLLPPISESLSKSIAEGKDIRWNKQQINSVMLQSILQGESIPKIAQRLADTVGEKNYNSAVRNARTMTTRAENYGRLDSYKRAEKMGIKMKKQWVATLDHVTRDSHVDVDGEVVDVDATFSNGLDCPGGMGPPEEVYNCFVGEVEAATDSDIIRSYKHEYEGELYSIKTAGGVNFTCTPNHPILTPRGWVAARLLNKGDDLLITFLGEKGVSGSDPDINHIFARFDTIHKLANKLGGKRTRTLGMDFHGDIPTSEVEIITLKRFLGNNRNAIQTEKQGKRVFILPDSSFVSKCAFIKHFGTVCASAFRFVRGLCQTLPFFGRSVGHSCEHGFGTVTDMDTVFPKYAIDNLPTETMIRGNLLRGLSTDVFVDKVVDVDVSFSNCHVYNLQTENGYYFVKSSIPKSGIINNGICVIAKNCRCTMIAQLKGFETDASDLSLRPTEALGDMSYNEWKEYHRNRLNETKRGKDNAENRFRNAVENFRKIPNPTEDDIKAVGAALRERMGEVYKGIDNYEQVKTAYSEAYGKYCEAWNVQNDIDGVWNMYNEDLRRSGYEFTRGDSTDQMLWKTFSEREKDSYIQNRILGIERKIGDFGISIAEKDTVFDIMKKMEGVVNPRYDEAKATRAAYDELRNKITGRQAANALKAELSKVRDMGTPAGVDLKAHLNNSQSKNRKIVEEAYNYYPSSWIQNSVEHGTITMDSGPRGWYKHNNFAPSELRVSGSSDESKLKTSVHELGHRFERTQNIVKDEKAFYDRRTAGEGLEWLGSGYGRDEKTRRDDFFDPYVGKDYGERAYEVASMGFENAYMDPMTLYADPDMTNLIYGILSVR